MNNNRWNNNWEEQEWHNRQPQRQNPQNYQPQNQYPDQDSYRGSYRLDNQRPDDYRNLHEENFGENRRYSHPSGFRTDQNYEMRNSRRNQSFDRNDYGPAQGRNYNHDTTNTSQNFGSMGSYGGAQGFGSSRNGYSSGGWASGHQGAGFQPTHMVYGAYRDRNSFAAGEDANYDGSQRYGSQGAASSGRRPERQNAPSRREDSDSRYEIYDTALSQYNRGYYGNPSQGSVGDDFNLRSHQNYAPPSNYGSRQRARNRQGSGYDQYYDGTEDIGYGNTAGSLSVGYNGPYGTADSRNRYYDPLSGETWGYNSDRT